MKWIEIMGELERKKCFFFSTTEFCAIVGGGALAAKRLLQSYARRGLVARVKRGYYLVPAQKPPDMFIANKLYFPSYVSLSYALSYYHIIPEVVYTMTSVTTMPTREFDALGRLFSYSKIKTKAYTGYVPVKNDNYTILLATPEKALADYLYFIVLRKKEISERLDLVDLNTNRFMKYVGLFGNNRLTKLAEALLCSQKKK